MKSSMRSRLLEQIRPEAARQDWPGLIAEYGTPLLILDPAKVAGQCRLFMQHLPGVRPHYAIKAAPHPAVLNAVAAAGGGFDVASNAEVDLVRSLGIPMDRCIHTHPIKKVADIEHAYRAGVRTFVVDNPCRGPEVHRTARRHRDPGAAGVPQRRRQIGSVEQIRRRTGRRGTTGQTCARSGSQLPRLQLPCGQPGFGGRAVPHRPAHDDRSRRAPAAHPRRDAPRPSTSAVVSRSTIARRCPTSRRSGPWSPPCWATNTRYTLLAEPGRFLSAGSMSSG